MARIVINIPDNQLDRHIEWLENFGYIERDDSGDFVFDKSDGNSTSVSPADKADVVEAGIHNWMRREAGRQRTRKDQRDPVRVRRGPVKDVTTDPTPAAAVPRP